MTGVPSPPAAGRAWSPRRLRRGHGRGSPEPVPVLALRRSRRGSRPRCVRASALGQARVAADGVLGVRRGRVPGKLGDADRARPVKSTEAWQVASGFDGWTRSRRARRGSVPCLEVWNGPSERSPCRGRVWSGPGLRLGRAGRNDLCRRVGARRATGIVGDGAGNWPTPWAPPSTGTWCASPGLIPARPGRAGPSRSFSRSGVTVRGGYRGIGGRGAGDGIAS